MKMKIDNFVIHGLVLLVLGLVSSGVHGLKWCDSSTSFNVISCNDDQYCCGTYNNECCQYSVGGQSSMDAVVGVVVLLIIFVCCPWMCYRCCCRRTTNRGIIYSAAGTNTSMSVSLPPPGMQQQVPYPTVVPYPQQTPYPPQYPVNPYYGVPPPAYGLPVQADMQQASAPTAPPYAQS